MPVVSSPSRVAARALGAGVAAVLAAGLLVASPPAAAASPPGPRAVDAARWLASQVTDDRIHNGQFDFDDWGLTLDAYLALVATQRRTATADRLLTTASRHAGAYVRPGGDYAAGATAKLLLARRVGARDATVRVGGDSVNLRARLLRMVAPSGRVRDEGPGEFSSTLTQSLAVLALSRSGNAPRAVVEYLLRQRCRAGFFREALGASTCTKAGADPYVDSTAFALQALVAARADGADLPRGLVGRTADWLVSAQHDNGAWSAKGGRKGDNTNSTGLAAQALAAVAPSRSRDRAMSAAAGFVRRLQITPARAAGGPAADEIGAIARTRDDLATALAKGITRATRDSFRRATTQAQFALVRVPLGVLRVGR